MFLYLCKYKWTGACNKIMNADFDDNGGCCCGCGLVLIVLAIVGAVLYAMISGCCYA